MFKRKPKFLSVTITFILLLSLVVPSFAFGAPSDSSETAFRESFYALRANYEASGSALETVFVDNTNVIHTPVRETIILPDEASSTLQASRVDSQIAYSMAQNSGFNVGDLRSFNIRKYTSAEATVQGKLLAKSTHCYVWIVNDAAYHSINLTDITPALAQEIANTFDGIYNRMTAPTTGFGSHAGMSYMNGSLEVGDMGKDGMMSILLYDIGGNGGVQYQAYTSGFFDSGDMLPPEFFSGNNLDMFHMDVGRYNGYANLTSADESKRLEFYGTLAHEFQHALFNINLSRAHFNSYLWLNESLSSLAYSYYAVENKRAVMQIRYHTGLQNEYSPAYSPSSDYGTYGDFLTFNGSFKSYGMGNYFADYLRMDTPNFVYRVYNSLKSNSAADLNDRAKMNALVGKALKAALGITSTQQDAVIFQILYYMFCEWFASDGGKIYYIEDNLSFNTKRFLDELGDLNYLWYGRPRLGTTHPFTGSNYTPFETIGSGGKVSLKGYGSGQAVAGVGKATHEKFYRINKTGSAGRPYLSISKTSSPGAVFYLVIPNANPLNGASVYLISSPDLRIDTSAAGSGDIYLMVATFNADIDATVTFNWHETSGGSVIKDGWVGEGGVWYFYRNNVKVTSEWIGDGGYWYYMGATGAMTVNNWAPYGSDWCYLGPEGKMMSNHWAPSGASWYYIGANGFMAYDFWVTFGGAWYYLGGNGAMVVSDWIEQGDAWYYADENGVMVTGIVYIGGQGHVFRPDGIWTGYL